MNKRRLLAIVSSVSIVVGAAAPLFAAEPTGAVLQEARWPSLGGDYSRSGLSADRGPADACVKWTFETGGAVLASPTVGADGRLHLACEDGTLYTLDADGALLWSVDVNTPLLSAPSIGPDGGLYVGSQDGTLSAIDADGNRRWTYLTAGAVCSSPAVVANGDVFVGSGDGTLHALAGDGTELWQFATKGPGALPTGAVFASPSLGADGTVYIAGLYDPNLYALDPADGSVKWVCNFALYPADTWDPDSHLAGGWPFASPVVAADGTIYQTLLYDRHLYAIDPNDGLILWATDLLDPASGWFDANDLERYGDTDGWSEPALGPDGTLYVSLDDPYLRAVDPDGAIKWATPLGEIGAFTLTVDRDGLIYAAGDDGHVYIVDPTGLEVARFEAGGWPVYPVIAGEDMLVVADSKDYSMLNTDTENTVWAISSACMEPPAMFSQAP